MSKSIPKAKKKTESHVIPKAKSTRVDKIVFSFESFEETEYFRLEGTCNNWSRDLFQMMKDVSSLTKTELMTSRSIYRVHSHENAKPPSPLPTGVQLKDCYQIRISKSKGGIHGIFSDNTFYVIWLDPLHNMYPDEKYGGLRVVKPGSTCCKDRDEIIEKLYEENNNLKEELKIWEELDTETN